MTKINIFQHANEFVNFTAGQHLFESGDEGDTMYVIQDGEVDIIIHGTVVETVSQGGIVGEMALIDNSPRSGAAIARTEVRAVPLNERRFMYMVQQTPNFALQVMTIMAERLRRADAHL